MFLSKSTRSKRKKKVKNNDKSERKKKNNTKKGKDKERSERVRKARAEYKKEEAKEAAGGTTGGTTAAGTTGTGPSDLEDKEKGSKFDKKKKEETPPPPKPDPWSGEEAAKRMLATGVFSEFSTILTTLTPAFKELCSIKPTQDDCPVFKQNIEKIRAPDMPILDDKLVKLKHADNFICAAKVAVPEFTRTMILTQVPDVTNAPNIEDFWRMIFHEEVVSVVIAMMPLECSVTLQQLFPIGSGTFANHGKMFINNKKVGSAVGMTSYTLELLPDGCSNSVTTTVYHLHNWRQKRGLDNVNELVTTLDTVVKSNENTVFVSMNGVGRAGTMLGIFTAMVHINKDRDVKMKEILDKLRLERCGIVESAEQYVTIHKALALWFKKKSQDEEIVKKVAEFSPSL